MQRVSITVDREAECRQIVDRIWGEFGVRGEVQVRRLGADGKFRIDVIAERDLTTEEWNQIPGKHT